MKQETIFKIRSTPLLYQYLKQYSYEYKNIYRSDRYLKEIEQKAKETYKVRFIDKVEQLENNIRVLQTFMDVLN